MRLVYDVFEKYRSWLAESRLFDLNLIADWLAAHSRAMTLW